MSERPAVRVIEALFATQWAMTEDYLRTMLAIADRAHEISPEALEQMRSRRVSDAAESLAIRDGVGIVSLRGPMFRYADFFSSISGATTYEGLALDMRRAADDASMRAILLNVDSPGGEVNGVQEAASAIRDIDRHKKPVVAYVGGTGASAAYLLASAAREVVAAPNAILGSIGVRSAIRDTTAKDERLGVRTVEFVSSQSPNKKTDLNTDEGRARIQKTVDALAESFIRHVAEFRGLTAEQVVSQFGQGGVEVGDRAVAAGMADRLGSFEGVLAELARGAAPPTLPFKPRGVPIVAERTPEQIAAEQRQHEEALARARSEGGNAAMARVQQILALDEAKDREPLAREFAFNTELPLDKVKGLLAAAQKTPAVAAPATPAPRDAGARRAADQPGGLLHTDDPGKKGEPVKIDYAGIYDRFSGREPARRH